MSWRKGCFPHGWLRLSVQGGSTERLLQSAREAGILLWDIRPCFGGCTLCMHACDLRQLRAIRRRSGCSIRILQKKGLPFLLRRFGISRALICGVLLAVLELMLLGRTVFLQEFYGSVAATPHELSRYLAQCGLLPFALQSELDAERISGQLLASPYGVAWAAVNFRYGRAEIELRGLQQTPASFSNAKALCAACDAQITRMEITAGVPCAEVGDVVRAGDVLVQAGTGMHGGAWADSVQARVWGYVRHTETVRVNKYQLLRTESGRSAVRRSLIVGNAVLPLGRADVPFRYRNCETKQHAVQLFGVPLPVLLQTQRYSEVQQSAQYLTEQQADALFQKLLHTLENERLADARVVSRSAQRTDTGDAFVYTVQYLLEREVGSYVQ